MQQEASVLNLSAYFCGKTKGGAKSAELQSCSQVDQLHQLLRCLLAVESQGVRGFKYLSVQEYFSLKTPTSDPFDRLLC